MNGWNIIPWRFGSDHFPSQNGWFVGSSRSSSRVYRWVFQSIIINHSQVYQPLQPLDAYNVQFWVNYKDLSTWTKHISWGLTNFAFLRRRESLECTQTNGCWLSWRNPSETEICQAEISWRTKELPSQKLTVKAPESRQNPKKKSSSNHWFSGATVDASEIRIPNYLGCIKPL